MDKDTVLGKTEKAIGHVKETAGKLSGDKDLQAEGVEDQARGQVQAIIGAIKQVGKDITAGARDGAEAAKRNA